jgi:cytochrome c-type biogenesis protein
MIPRRVRVGTVVLALGSLMACGRGGDARPAASVGADSSAGAFRPLATGEAVPIYAASTLGGDTVRLGGAQAVTVLNVWATWCTSCREEMSDLEAIRKEFAPRGVRVIGVSVDGGDGTRVRRFAEGEKLAFTVAHDPEQRIQQLYQVVGVPETFVIGKDGKLLWRHVGNLRPVVDSVRAVLSAATGGA